MRALWYHSKVFSHPVADEPAWSGLVDRWYQLDAPAHGLAELAHSIAKTAHRPDLVLLASPGASNASDAAFVESRCASPSKFAHTLPSARGSALCQALGWSGPVLCLQKDPSTCALAIREAMELQGPRYPTLWIAGVRPAKDGAYEAYCFEVFHYSPSPTPRGPAPYRLEPSSIPDEEAEEPIDTSLFEWLADGRRKEGAAFRLGPGLALVRSVAYG